MFNIATNVFVTKTFSGNYIYGMRSDSLGRFVINGFILPNGYTAQFMPESLIALPEFQVTPGWTMNALLSGTDDILADSGQTVGAITTQTVATASYTTSSSTYVPGTSYNSDVSYYTSSQTYIYAKNVYIQVIPDLTCSISGSTSISFSLTSYNGNTVPTWVTINTSTGQLSITTPSPSVNTDYPFYISSTISGVSSAINKLITITVSSCTASN